jgi:ribosomal protein L30/L7E
VNLLGLRLLADLVVLLGLPHLRGLLAPVNLLGLEVLLDL